MRGRTIEVLSKRAYHIALYSTVGSRARLPAPGCQRTAKVPRRSRSRLPNGNLSPNAPYPRHPLQAASHSPVARAARLLLTTWAARVRLRPKDIQQPVGASYWRRVTWGMIGGGHCATKHGSVAVPTDLDQPILQIAITIIHRLSRPCMLRQ
jgi:hypothetical protein